MRVSGAVKIGGRAVAGHGANTATVERSRKGYSTWFSADGFSVKRVSGDRFFTPDELFRIYQICPDVRAPIDKIALRVSHTPWMCVTVPRKLDADYERAMELAQRVASAMSRPNTDEDWTTFAGKWSRDLLIYDAYAVERVYSGVGKLQELIAWRSGDITPQQDEHGRVFAYRQDMAIRGPVNFLPEELDYGNMFPNTTFPTGQPIIETLIEEVITMRAQAQHLRRLVDADEIPPGILALVGVGDVALKRFEAKIKAQKGQDDLFRIVSTEDPGGKIDWIQLQRSLKDLEWLPNIREVRKTIWRLFHVTPVTMGETDAVPRASAEVQVEIADQGLIGPMLRKLERLVNERWIPLILGSEADAALVRFQFDLTPDLSQVDQKTRADRLATLIGAEVISTNEAREELGYDPVEHGDKVASPAEQTTTEAAPVAESLNRPGVVRASAVPYLRARNGGLVARGALPSEWQEEGKFKDVRTLSLRSLGGLIRDYDDTVTPLYDLCAKNVLREATDALADGELTPAELTRIVSAVARETARLVESWSNETTPYYDGAARLGADTGTDWGGVAVAWRNRSQVYQAAAVQYLTASGKYDGIVTSIRKELTALSLAALSRGVPKRTEAQQRAEKLPAELGAFLEAIRRVFERNRHRISHWSGKLSELAHGVLTTSLSTPVAKPKDAGGTSEADPWMVEWVAVADRRTCSTCDALGDKGFQPVSSLTTVPGGATECGALCRCVLVYWLKSEVDSGKATRLGLARSYVVTVKR